MTTEFQYVELNKAEVSQDVLRKFNCDHPDFNDYLVDDAKEAGEKGNGVTYILVDKEEYESKTISVIFAFATIQTTALHYYDVDNTERVNSISGVEIKYFAIARSFQKQTAYKLNPNKHFSTIFFEWLLADLYEISISVVGFQAIFLRANENGESLYRRKNFVDATNYIIPFEEDDVLGKCTPMCLMIQENVYSIFGIE